MESNQFGTDEFLKWCEVVGTEPYFCLNFGTGELCACICDDKTDNIQAHWMKVSTLYTSCMLPAPPSNRNQCQPSAGSSTATATKTHTTQTCEGNMVAKSPTMSAPPTPRQVLAASDARQVKYWALGNEVWGPWQVEQMTKEDYAKKAYQWAKAIKLLDPSVKLILCGETGYSSWDFHVIKECIKLDLHGLGGSTTVGLIDMHSIHIYTASSDHAKNATGRPNSC